MTAPITIAIDGYAACGKSTLAKALAKALGYVYVDSGAMYRAVTLYLLRHQIPLDDLPRVQAALDQLYIEFRNIEGKNTTFLNNENVEEAIRSMEVSNLVSPVSTISIVRKALVQRQQEMGKAKAIVMDGRDIGTVVFKDAELKLFMTASIEKRTQRRLAELHSKGIKDISLSEVKRNLLERDQIDSTRQDSPLRQAVDAIIIDNTNLTPEEQFQMALSLAQQRIQKKTKSLILV
jgi:cytidylate kinase